MLRTETKPKSVRKPLSDLSNKTGNIASGKFSKPTNVADKSVVLNKMEKQQKSQDDDCLDKLLLVQADLNSITRGIDEIVAEAFKLNTTSKEAKCEIESFACFLSNTIEALKPWIPRFQKLISPPSIVGAKNASNLNNEADFDVDSPLGEKFESLISPSPLVSWRAGCDVERGEGRQLFLLTPLPMSKTLSLTRQGLGKSVFERINSVEFPSMLVVPENVDGGDSRERVAGKEIPSCGSVSKGEKSVLVMTPCLKMSPPKSCVLLEPISESSHKGNEKVRKSTPFPVGIHSRIPDSSGSDGSEDLSLRYPELLGIQQAYKSRIQNKKLDESPQWGFSPPKTCVLLNPSDEKPENVAAVDPGLPVRAPVSKENEAGHNLPQAENLRKEAVTGISKTTVECTPMCKEPESTLRRGKPPGETTLKRELWTRFEAASSYGFRVNAAALQRTAKKGFIEMLDEASCDEEGADGFR